MEIEHSISWTWRQRLFFERGAFSDPARAAEVLGKALEDSRLALVLMEDAVAAARPELGEVLRTALGEKLAANPLIVPGGESAKRGQRVLQLCWDALEAARIDRHSSVIVVGGGALLDVAGLAAATAHRGVRLVRIPTTTLAQADSAVGVKNGINAFGKKNFLGSFAVPQAVVVDTELLSTQPPDSRRAGYAEAVKVALIRDAEFFHWLEENAARLAEFEPLAEDELVRRSALLHARHIATGGDPFELGSSRPLDFGHWAAHKLEQLTDFQLGHGEAVAIGVALDTVYSGQTGLLPQTAARRVLQVLAALGLKLWHPALRSPGPGGDLALFSGLEEFREHLGGELTITLLAELGRGVEVHHIDRQQMVLSLNELERLAGELA